jgi:SAM-dependent methyltransferase
MKTTENQHMNFANWVPVKMIFVPGLLGLVCVALGFIHWGFWIPAFLFLIIGAYFGSAWTIFSSRFGNLQDKIQDLVISQIDWNGKGKVLDIGCGNGPLTIKVAQRYPQTEVVGMDYWGKNWDYSMKTCTSNAKIAGVEKQVSFRQGSASALPFEEASFDLIVSNLVFHEVQDVKDKRISIREALRVLKPGGVFVLQDLFLLTPYYGTPDELMNIVREWGVSKVEFIRTCEEPFIPGLVKLPFMVGALAILRGIK